MVTQLKFFPLFCILVFIFCLQSFSVAQQAHNMTRIGHWTSNEGYNDCWGFTNGGYEFAVIGSYTKVHFIDVTDPICPVLVDEFTPGASSTWRDFKFYQNYIYACADVGAEGLLIFDVGALPNTVTYLGNDVSFFAKTHNIYIDEQHGRLYAVGSDTQRNGIIVLDIATDPENPVLLASIDLPGGYIHDVHVVDNIAYCSHLSRGMYIYDLTDPTAPVTLGSTNSYPGQIFNHSAWLNDAGTHLVFCDEKHGEPVKILDVTDPTDLFVSESNLFMSQLLAPEHTNSIAHNAFTLGNLAFIAYYHDGLQVFDISDPNNVTNVAYYDSADTENYNGYSGVWGAYPFLPSGNILMSDRTNGLYVVRMGCSTDITITTPTVSGLHAASNNVVTLGDQLVQDKTIFRAENCIELNPGFEVPDGVRFEATMDGCN